MRCFSAILALCIACVFVSGETYAQPKPAKPPPKALAKPTIQKQADDILCSIEEYGDINTAQTAANGLFDSVIAWAADSETVAFRDSALVQRLVSQLAKAPPDTRADLAKLLRANHSLAAAIGWTIRPEDDLPKVFTLLDRLRKERPDTLDEFANLVAAVCVVYDKPVAKVAFQGAGKPLKLKVPDALDVYDYFVAKESRWLLGDLKKMPPELLVYVVDMNEPSSDWKWAHGRLRSAGNVGAQYNNVPYDDEYFRDAAQKKWVGKGGWSLKNILDCGGVCEDRAFFTAGIAKANGIPATYCNGRSDQVGHAWVGVLEVRNGKAEWNFSYGRFGDYNNLSGDVFDPQTGVKIADSIVSLLAESHGDQAARADARALVAAVERLASLRSKVFTPPQPQGVKTRVTQRRADMRTCQEMLEEAFKKCPTYVPGWQVLAGLGRDEQFTIADRDRWSEDLIRRCGKKYPDFVFEVMKALIQGVPEPKDRDPMWKWCADRFVTRPDLVAQSRFLQAADLKQAGNHTEAGKAYYDIIQRFPNDGPFVVTALQRCETLLRDARRDAEVPGLYEKAWQRINRPKESAPEFYRQSNWFRVGKLYSQSLNSAGRLADADKVMKQLGVK